MQIFLSEAMVKSFVTLIRKEPTQDEIARIRKRKRGRNMLNRSGNTTDNLCFRYQFRDVFSLRLQRNRTTFCACFRQVSAKGNKCFRNRNFGFTFAETQENVAETCLFHVSVDVFRATEWVMEPAETQETVLETEVCFMFPLQLTSRKYQYHCHHQPTSSSSLSF